MGGKHSKQVKPKDQNYSVAAALAADEDPVQQAFVQRRTTLTQEQWDKFLSRDAHASNASLNTLFSSVGHGHGVNKVSSGKSDAPVSYKGSIVYGSKKMRDVEADENGNPVTHGRLRRSIFGLPLGSPLTRLYKSWSTLILMLDLIYTAFLVPILVGFEISDVDFGWGCLVNLIAGGFYFVELLLGFHVGFVGKLNARKKLVMDGKAVAWFYTCRGQFYVDTITAIAWIAQICLIIITVSGRVDLSGSSVTTIYQIIRILRMIRFVSLMNRLYAAAIAAGGAIFPALNLSPQYAYFFNLIYGGLVILSFLSCLMNFVARKEGFNNTWINYFVPFTRDYGGPSSPSELSSDQAGSIPDPVLWLAGAYFMLVTMLSVGYGDITPHTNPEIIVCMFALIAGIIFFGILLGSIAEALNDLNKESKRIARYRARMEQVDKWMSRRHLPKSLRSRIGHHYQEEWLMEAEAVEEVQIMEELPHSLRREIAFNINRKVFQQLSVFHDFPAQELAAICGMMMPLQLPAGADVCEADDVADCIWILHEGVVVEVNKQGIESHEQHAPALLGETALLRELDNQYHFRPCALRTHQMCLLWVIPMRDLLPLLKRHPQLYHKACSQVVPKVLMDYLTIDPLEAATMSGVAPPMHHGQDGQGGRARPGSALDGKKGSNGSVTWQDHQHAANPSKDGGLPSRHSNAQGNSGQSQGGGKQNLQSTKSAGSIASKPSWTKLQQDNLKAKKARTHHQSQGFNGMVQ